MDSKEAESSKSNPFTSEKYRKYTLGKRHRIPTSTSNDGDDDFSSSENSPEPSLPNKKLELMPVNQYHREYEAWSNWLKTDAMSYEDRSIVGWINQVSVEMGREAPWPEVKAENESRLNETSGHDEQNIPKPRGFGESFDRYLLLPCVPKKDHTMECEGTGSDLDNDTYYNAASELDSDN